MIVGIVSNGPSVCGMQPVVFHKVANSIGWVADTMARKANGGFTKTERLDLKAQLRLAWKNKGAWGRTKHIVS